MLPTRELTGLNRPRTLMERRCSALAKAQHDMIDPSKMKGNGRGTSLEIGDGFQEVWTRYRFKRVAVMQG